jgi:hypothetical protein
VQPPADVWKYLRRLGAKYGLGLPNVGLEGAWLLLLLKAAYGLDDAPLLWRTELADWLKSQGWAESKFDRCMFYRREGNDRRGRLIGKLTLHIDDEGAGGTEAVLAELIKGMTARFGELKVQRDQFRHIGHEHEQTWHADGSTTIREDQEFYSETIKPIPIPPGLRTTLLDESQVGSLRVLNGEMSYAKDTRPDAMGRIAFSQQNVDKDACVQHLVDANDALKVLQHVDAEKSLRFAQELREILPRMFLHPPYRGNGGACGWKMSRSSLPLEPRHESVKVLDGCGSLGSCTSV